MENKTEEQLKEESKKLSIKSGMSVSLMGGFGTKYNTPYALFLGASNTIVGLIDSLPSFLGTLSQIKGSKLIDKIPRKKIVLYGTSAQLLFWIPIIIIGYLFIAFNLKPLTASLALLFFYTLVIVSGTFTVPAWSSWMKDLLTKNGTEYFGRRTKLTNLVELICILIGGFILNYFRKTSIFKGFLILFTLAIIGRGLSIYFLSKKYEPKLEKTEGYYFTFSQFLKKMPSNNFGKFVIFTTLISFANAIASPFFAVYMLKNLSFNYLQFTLVTITSMIITILTLPLWGKFASKYGNIKVIKITGIFISFIPLLWFFSVFVMNYNPGTVLFYLIAVEIFSGLWWAGLNLSTSCFVYDAVTKERMAICITYDNITTAVGVLAGALLGGMISSSSLTLLGLNSILIVFLLSFIARLVVGIIMLPKIKEVRTVDKWELKAIKKEMFITPKYFSRGIFRTGFQNGGSKN